MNGRPVICHWPMRKLFLFGVLAPCLAVLIGCPKKKEETPPEADAAPAVVAAPVDAAPALPAAKNAADIARFPNAEKPVTDDTSKLVDFFSQVRTGPKQGAVVATLKAGIDPVKIAEHQDCFLIQFPDPKDANVQLMGWIPKAAFTTITVVDAGIKDAAGVDSAFLDAGIVTCPAGQEAIVAIAAVPVCRKRCVADKDCKNPTPGACHTANNSRAKVVKVCAAEAP
jgi:hypothetical protein